MLKLNQTRLEIKQGVYSYICINYDLINQSGEFNNASVNGFINTLAHEYFHALQAQAGMDFEETTNKSTNWLIESTATATGLYYYNSINPNGMVDNFVDNLFNNRIYYYFNSSNQSINDYTVESDNSEADDREYATFIFFMYLIKEYGFNIISELIVEHGDSQDTIAVIDELLQTQGTTLGDVFKEFAKITCYANINYTDVLNNLIIDFWHLDKNEYDKKILINEVSTRYQNTSLQELSSYYLYLVSDKNLEFDVFVTIGLTSKENIDITSARKTESGSVYYYTYEVNTTSITIPQYNFGYHNCKELTFIITNYNINASTVSINCTCNIQ